MRYKDLLITGLSYLKQPKKRKLITESFKLKNKFGIEIGGPSRFFSLRGGFPIYLMAERIDGVNFSIDTVWEGKIKEGESYAYYPGKKGFQYIAEATNLSGISNEKYDFILSSHSLEHVANPIKALMEWKRVCKAGGTFVLILPDKQHTFDSARPYTSFEHLLQDYNTNMTEHDQTHFEEIIKTYDPSKDTGFVAHVDLREALEKNYATRTAHHHVFSLPLVKELLDYCGFQVTHQQEMDPHHLITLAYKK